MALNGQDTLVAGSGLATLVGGTGNDTFVVNNTNDVVTVASAATTNLLFSSATFVLPSHVNTLTLTGSADIAGTGNGAADTLTAGAGNDTLTAGAGIAVMNGGVGATTFVVNNTADVVQNASASQANSLQSSVSYTLPTNVNLLTLTGTGPITGTGNAGADTLVVANSGVDTLVSGSGNDLFILGNSSAVVTNAYTTNSDTIQSSHSVALSTNVNTLVLIGTAALAGQANSGNDTLISNSGVDVLTGGAGNDTFVVNNTSDTVQGASATSSNTIVASVNVTLPVNVNTLTLTGTADLQATGNAAADIITANSGNDTLTAVSTAAATTLVGGTGNDVFVVNSSADAIQSASTTASDTIQSSVNFTAVANVNTLVLTGTAALQATANNAGDTLVSNTGVDTLVGSTGNDVFVVNNSADVLVNLSAGDTVQSSVGYAVATPGVTLVLTGSANLAGAVTGSGDTLVAGDGTDTLTAAGPSETLVGGAGNDLFVVGDPSDVVLESTIGDPSDVAAEPTGGTGTIQSTVSYTLPDYVDSLTLTGNANLTGTGNTDYANVLTANNGNDVLNGTAISNTIYGGNGSDRIYAGPADNLIHAGSGGTLNAPTVVIGDTHVGGISSDIIYGDTGVNYLFGGADANTIVGGSATQGIYAEGDSDLITAGNGGTAADPTYVFGNQDSTINRSSTINGGTGVDVIYGGAGSDLITAATGSTTVYAGTGYETVYGAGGSNVLDASSGHSLLVAGAGTETISGTGADTLVAGAGVDHLSALAGSDVTYEFQPGSGTSTIGSTNARQVWNYATQAVAFGVGIASSDVTYGIAGIGVYGDLALVLNYGSGSTEIAHGLDAGAITGVTFAGSPTETFAQFMNSKGTANTVVTPAYQSYEINTGNGQVVPVSGMTGVWAYGSGDVINDIYNTVAIVSYGDQTTIAGANITAEGSGDVLTLTSSTGGAVLGGANDTLTTGSGHYGIEVDNASAVINAAAPFSGTDSLSASVSYTLPANFGVMLLESTVGGLFGTSNAQGGYLAAQGSNDTLRGGAGADTLVAQNSNDVLVGGSGAETYILQNATDSIQFGTGAASLNSVQASFNYALTSAANSLIETGNNSTGTGNAGRDVLIAEGSNDTLYAGTGNSTLTTLSSAPATLVGGGGNDLFVINSSADVVQETSTTVADTIRSSASFTLPANINNLVMTDGGYQAATANAGNDQLISTGINDTLIAGAGADTLVGGTSLTSFVFNAGFGHDQVLNVQSGDVLSFGAGIARSSLTFAALIGGSGTAPSLVVTSTSGGSVTLQGGLAPGAISQVKFGDGTSSDVASLVAPTGHSTTVGAHGNLIISSANGDVITGGSGQDTILAWGSNDTLSAGTGGAVIYSIGSGTRESGSAGADTLTALGTGSTIIGGAGSEVFVISDASTVISVPGGGGHDTVLSSVSFTLPANVSDLTLTGTSSLNATGNAQSDVLVANSGNDTLTAGAGLATLIGGSGTDMFVVNNSGDVVQNPFGVTNDQITSYSSYTLSGSVNQIHLVADSISATGNGQNDDLEAYSYYDTLTAAGGNNSLYATGQYDVLTGGTGNDSLSSFGANNTLVTGSGVDTVHTSNYDTVYVNNSADVLLPLGQFVTLYSSVSYTFTTSVQYGGSFIWQANGAANVVETYAGTNNPASLTMVANSGNDTLVGSYWDTTFESGAGVDTLVGRGVRDTYLVSNSADIVIANPSGADEEVYTLVTFTMPANVSQMTAQSAEIVLTGNSGNNLMVGEYDADTLIAGSGNDTLSTAVSGTLVAGSGHDLLISGDADTFVFNSGFGFAEVQASYPVDQTIEFGTGIAASNISATAVIDSSGHTALQLSVGAGRVTLDGALSGTNYQFEFGTGAVVGLSQFLAQVNLVASTIAGGSGNLISNGASSMSLSTGSGSDTLISSGANDTLVSGGGSALIEGFGANNVLTGASGTDTLIAYGSGSTLQGGSGATVLEALGSNETLVGGSAADSLIAGSGSGVLFMVNNASDFLEAASGATADTISSSVSSALPAAVDTLVLTGSLALQGRANGDADTIFSNSGADTLYAGAGKDLFILNNAADSVVGMASGGVDTVKTSFSFTLPAYVADLILAGSDNLTGTGNSLANIIQANSGNDTLTAGSGTATLIGGSGNDLFVVDKTADSVVSASTTSTDTISSSVTFALPTNVNTLVMTGASSVKGSGNSANDLLTAVASTGKVTLVAGNGNDTLVSGSGVDSLVGGTGSDLFIINNASDVVVVASTTGTDTIQSSFNDTLAANVSTLMLTGSTSIAGVGNTMADTIYGNSGSDTLTAGSGLATLIGGSGNNKFVVNNTNDVVVNNSTTNTDTISSSVTYTLPTHVNTLVLTTSGIVGTGNVANDLITASTTTGAVSLTAGTGTGADTLVAGSGADVLTSNSGIDSLVGGTGADLFILTNSADLVLVGTTHGVDTIQASFNDTLAANVGTLVLTGGSAALMGTGNSLADTLVANSGNDTLVAGTGLAKMIAGTGNDLFVINATGDSVTAATAGVSDTIQSSVSYTLPTNVQYLKLTGTASLVGGGNGSTSLVVGNTGNDTLNGGTGVAVLEAGTAGAQVLKAVSNQAALIGGGAADTLTGGVYKDFFAAGKVGDTITTGATANVIAVNKGDGATVIAPITGASNVLSLGAGIDTEALTLTKSGNNLVLNDGVAGDSITFTNWFASTANQTTTTLQVIEAASASYNSAGSDVLRNKPIEEFNFTTLVSQFIAASSPSAWMLSQKEAADTIASSATADYGGDLAYYYGKNGNLTGMNLSASQSTLTNASYATGLQTIDAWAGISGGTLTLNVVGGSSSAATQLDTTPASQPTVNDGRATVLPVTSDNMKHAAYVNTNALVAALGTEDMPKFANWAQQRETFSALWASMHRQIDMVSTNTLVGTGAEAQAFDLAPDPVAMLSGSGATPRSAACFPFNEPQAGLVEARKPPALPRSP